MQLNEHHQSSLTPQKQQSVFELEMASTVYPMFNLHIDKIYMVIKSLESVDLLSNPFLRNGRFFKHALKIGNRGCN